LPQLRHRTHHSSSPGLLFGVRHMPEIDIRSGTAVHYILKRLVPGNILRVLSADSEHDLPPQDCLTRSGSRDERAVAHHKLSVDEHELDAF